MFVVMVLDYKTGEYREDVLQREDRNKNWPFYSKDRLEIQNYCDIMNSLSRGRYVYFVKQAW